MNRLKHISIDDFFVLLCTIFITTSFVIAFLSVSSQAAFYYDQARDGYQAYSIWHDHHLKILGPPTDIPGIFHGVVWYYFLAPLYWLGNGNPIFVVSVLTVMLYLTVPACGFIAYSQTKKRNIAFLSMALYSCAPLFVNFSHWLSNPVLTVLVMPFLVYSLWRFIVKPNSFYAGCTGLFYGLMLQSDFAFLPLLIIVPLYVYIFKLKINWWHIFSFILVLFSATSTFFVASIKFHSNMLGLIFQNFFANSSLNMSVTSAVLAFIDSLIQFLSITYVCLPLILSVLVIGYIFYRLRGLNMKYNNKQLIFLLIWTTSILVLFAINHGNVNTIFFFAPILLTTSILCANLLYHAFTKTSSLIIVLLLFFGFQMLRNGLALSSQSSYLIIQPGMLYSSEMKVVDYTYQQAQGQPFVINAVTNPLYIATMWSYVYQFYGKPTYNYMPYWGGRSQVGQLGSFIENQGADIRFLILDPQSIIPAIWLAKITYDEDKISDVVDQKQIGQFIVQKRVYDPDKIPPLIPAVLSKDPEVLNFK